MGSGEVFHFAVSLRISHPSMEPEVISKRLGLTPKTAWKVGDQWKNPCGPCTANKHRETYWSYPCLIPKELRLSDFLKVFLEQIEEHKGFFQEIRATNGSVELFVGWFSGSNSGDTFRCQLLEKLADLQVD